MQKIKIIKINITAIIKSKPETIKITEALLTEMAVNSKLETACIQYDLHQSVEEPERFFFHEIWDNEEDLALHNEKPYIRKFVDKASEILSEKPQIYRTNKIY